MNLLPVVLSTAASVVMLTSCLRAVRRTAVRLALNRSTQGRVEPDERDAG